MKSTRLMSGMLGGLVVLSLAAGYAVGCSDEADNCDRELTCPKYLTMSTDGGSDSGTDGSNVDCSGDPTTTPAIVIDECGVFVSASAAPGGTGTMASPFQTFAEAAAAKPSRVYACAASYTETMQVSFTGGVEVFGGFTGCTAKSWTWSASMQAEITTIAGMPGVMLTGGANKLENVSATAPSAPMTMSGGSSIALLVNGGSLDMTNGALTAGDAQDGAAGTSLADDPTLDGKTGASGVATCNTGATSPGAMGATNSCATGGSSTSGNGGDGGDAMGDPAGSGTNGNSVPAATPSGTADGKGGAGEAGVACANGDNGAAGSAGSSGSGATSGGTLSKDGYLGNAGTDGTNGMPGQGGGGGGGAKGAMSVTCSAMTIARFGASGGAGGTGGCGGKSGSGGQPGGSSITLLVLDATVTLANVTLTAGKGGSGGTGGDGQTGGSGGGGGANGAGAPLDDACSGGKGGRGGNGGPAGGGQGGHSLGIAFQGPTSPTGGTFTIQMTNVGSGGVGGTGNTTANMGQGANGSAANCWDFGKNAACGM